MNEERFGLWLRQAVNKSFEHEFSLVLEVVSNQNPEADPTLF